MALIGMYGFDDQVAEVGVSIGGTGANGTGRAGFGRGCPNPALTPGGGYAEIYFGGAFLSSTVWLGNFIVSLKEGATTHLSVKTESDGRLSLYRGAGTTLLGTSASPALTASAWRYVEAHAIIADTGGLIEVRVDGTVVVSYSGDTRNAGTTGVVDTVALAKSSNFGDIWDDAYLCDATGAAPFNTYLGDIAVRTLLPTGNGDTSGFLGSDANSVDNYALVDEDISSATDYVGSQTSGATDLYQMGDLPAGYDVLALQELVYYAKSDAGIAPTLLPVAKGQVGTVRADTALPVASTTYISQGSQLLLSDPDGNPLTAARVNAMQVGVKVQ